jgi:hypothetical protein
MYKRQRDDNEYPHNRYFYTYSAGIYHISNPRFEELDVDLEVEVDNALEGDGEGG